MLKETHSKKYTTEHPDVSFAINFVFEVSIDHFWRSIHKSSVFFILVKHLVDSLWCALWTLWVQNRFDRWTKITQFERFAAKENIFDFDVSVWKPFVMHFLQAITYIYANMDNLFFRKFTVIFFKQVENCSTCAKLRQYVNTIVLFILAGINKLDDVLMAIYLFPRLNFVFD